MSGVRELDVSLDTAGWEDFKSRSNRVTAISKYFTSEMASHLINYSRFQRILSVGPGEGDVDSDFLALCPHVKEYTGLEPHPGRREEALYLLSTHHPHIKVDLHGESFENYQPDLEAYDAVLFMHTMYYFWNDFKAALQKALSMITEGGQVIIVLDDGKVYKKAEEQASGNYVSSEVMTILDQFRHSIKQTKIKYIEDRMEPPIVLDLTSEGKGYYDFLELVLARRMTVNEKRKVMDFLRESTRPGTSLLDLYQAIFFITK